MIHLESVPIVETFRGQTVWEEGVEVFKVSTPPPDRTYGWAVDHPSGPQYIAVLGKPPVDSDPSCCSSMVSFRSSQPVLTVEQFQIRTLPSFGVSCRPSLKASAVLAWFFPKRFG